MSQQKLTNSADSIPFQSPAMQALAKGFAKKLILIAVLESLVMVPLVVLYSTNVINSDQLTLYLMIFMVPFSVGMFIFLSRHRKKSLALLKQEKSGPEPERPKLVN